jgi:hypothetical protein
VVPTDLNALARRAVDVAITFARRAGRLAVGTALFVAVVALSTYFIGLAALSGSARSAWVLMGAALVIVAVGAPLLAWWRLFTVRRHANELIDDVRRLITGNPEAERVVIDTVEAQPAPAVSPSGRQELMVAGTQQFYRLRTISVGTTNLRRLPGAMYALTSYPILLGISLLMTLVFAALGFIFLLVWLF